MRPIDVQTRETVTFIASHVPPGAAILEVGCGEGHVALALLNRGYRVLGLDADQEVLTRARSRGVPTVHASWPEFEVASAPTAAAVPFDAVVFTRSLHHINPLREAVGKAREVLRPTGRLVVEDFAYDEVKDATIDWFLGALRSRTGKALIAPIQDQLVTDLLVADDPPAVWHAHHDHGLHTVPALTRAIAEHFIIREARPVPYLYRYLVPVLPESPEAGRFVEEVLQEEASRGERGEMALIGRRVVGSPRTNHIM